MPDQHGDVLTVQYDEPGTHDVMVTVTDDDGGTTDAWFELTIEDASVPEPAGLGLLGIALLALRRRSGRRR